VKIAYAASIVLLGFILAVAGASGTWIFWEAWRGSDREVFRALLGGFAGAFFAFFFLRIGEGLKQLFVKQEKNHVALVATEHYLNNCLGITGDNVFVADDFLELVSEGRLSSESAPVYLNSFTKYEIDRALLLGLTNIDLVNQLYSLNSSLRKLNDSMGATDRANDQLRGAFLSKPETFRESYIENMRVQRRKYIELRGFMIQARDDIIDAIASERVLLKSPPFFIWLLRLLTRGKYSSRFNRRFPSELAEVNKEIEQVGRASAERIKAARERTNIE
jgi:hypothetical protein